MHDELKEILEKLKDNIPIEEYRSEGTSDGLTHYEEDKDSWQYKLYNCITNLQEENERLSIELNKNMIERNNYLSRNEKAKEFIEHENFKRTLLGFSENKYLKNIQKKLLNILGGDDNE